MMVQPRQQNEQHTMEADEVATLQTGAGDEPQYQPPSEQQRVDHDLSQSPVLRGKYTGRCLARIS